jgi:hypothetical protein
LHFAATGKTAAELVAGRAGHAKPNMGLTAWKGKVVRKTDVTVAKNYLSRDEIGELNRIVTMWLDFAEDQASRRKQVFLQDWETKLNEFLRFNERAVLHDKGNVSKSEPTPALKPSTRSSLPGAAHCRKPRRSGSGRAR